MRKESLNTVFGLPTILTVLIVISVLGFASLSLVSANVDNKALQRSLTLLEGSYEAQHLSLKSYQTLKAEFDLINDFLPIGDALLPSIQAFIQNHPELVVSEDWYTFTLTETSGPYSVTIKVKIASTHSASDFTILSQILTIENDQDYSIDGDPIWKGPQ